MGDERSARCVRDLAMQRFAQGGDATMQRCEDDELKRRSRGGSRRKKDGCNVLQATELKGRWIGCLRVVEEMTKCFSKLMPDVM